MPFDQLKRREFITLIGGATAWPLAARAQQPERMRRVGVIMQMAEKDPQAQLNVLALQKGLLARGLNPGQNLRIEYRFGAASVEAIHTAVTDILATSPEVVLNGTARKLRTGLPRGRQARSRVPSESSVMSSTRTTVLSPRTSVRNTAFGVRS